MKKKIFAAFMAAALLATSAFNVLADYVPGREIDPDVMSTRMMTPQFKIEVNGNAVEAPAPFENEEGTLMIPLRAFTEALSFSVEWQDETKTIVMTKGPVYITMNALADGYTFSKTAPMLLGTAPVLTNGTTFVPVAFVEVILGGAYKIEMDGTVKLYDAESKDVALIESINAEEKQITVNDIVRGEVVLAIGDETTITDEEGNNVAFADLKEGMTLKITYGEVMTMSLPPINNPDVIVVKSSSPAVTIPSHEEVATADVAKITEINAEQNQITVNDSVRGDVVLNFAGDVKVTGAGGSEIKFADLKEGMTLEIVYGEAMTMSLPPINNPVSVKLIAE